MIVLWCTGGFRGALNWAPWCRETPVSRTANHCGHWRASHYASSYTEKTIWPSERLTLLSITRDPPQTPRYHISLWQYRWFQGGPPSIGPPSTWREALPSRTAVILLRRKCTHTEKTLLPIPFTLNGIWSYWQFSFWFWTKWNSILFDPFCSPRSYPIQCERNWKYSFLSVWTHNCCVSRGYIIGDNGGYFLLFEALFTCKSLVLRYNLHVNSHYYTCKSVQFCTHLVLAQLVFGT